MVLRNAASTIPCLAILISLTTLGQLTAQVSAERLRSADATPADWLTYNGNYASHRYSALDQINKNNVDQLQVAWIYQMQSPGLVETTPLVFDGLMVLTEPPSTVTTLDVRTGKRLWTWSPTIPKDVKTLGFPPVNRGVAVLGETVYVGTVDAWLYAIDLKSGSLRWKTQVADNATGHSITAAPLAVKDKIIVGISGGEAGIRGFIDAYDATTGELAWRFWTIPGPGDPGYETWTPESWRHGAGATWLTGSYDPELDLLYWGIGNPGPDWNGDVRPGDNLYTSSVVALDPDSGELRWHFQYTPHDTHDWDANQIQVLVDAELDGEPRKLLISANRNAFYYALDRTDGRFLVAAPYAKQTWAEGIDESGRPVVIPGTEPTEEGNLVWPSLQGATNWFSPSYHPEKELLFVATREMGAVYFKTDAEYEEGEYFMGGGEQALDGEQARGYIRALELRTGEKRWEFELLSPPWAGVVSTAGGLVFGGSNEGNLFALDADTGEPLWRFNAGGAVRTNPISYAVSGKQYVACAAGQALFVFTLPSSSRSQ